MKYSEGEKVMGFCRVLLLALIAVFLICPLPVNAEQLVLGRYLKGVGAEIIIELEIASPAPSLVIVSQNLPEGTKVVNSKPELKKYDPNKGLAKWLLSKVKPGKMTITLHLNRPVAKGEISGEIMSRNGAGRMVSVVLKN